MKKLLLSASLAAAMSMPAPASASGPDPYIGEVMEFAGLFCPRGWAKADGSVLSISKNTALFSLLGTTYGGDDRTNFKLPKLMSEDNLRNRRPLVCIAIQGIYPPRN